MMQALSQALSRITKLIIANVPPADHAIGRSMVRLIFENSLRDHCEEIRILAIPGCLGPCNQDRNRARFLFHPKAGGLKHPRLHAQLQRGIHDPMGFLWLVVLKVPRFKGLNRCLGGCEVLPIKVIF